MKKIMVYSKHARIFGDGSASLKENTDLVLFFTVFICGMLIGCSLFFASENNNISATAIGLFYEKSLYLNVLFRVSVICIGYLTGIIAGFSCVGVVLLLLLPFLYGMFYSMLASFLIMNAAANGLGLFSLTILPGMIISCTSLICFCAQSASVSRSAAAILFFGKKEEVNIKRYYVISGICLFASLLAIAADHITNAIFSGLF